METNLYCYARTGRTISEKTMEDGNNGNIKDEKNALASLANCQGSKSTTNGHEVGGETSGAPDPRRAAADAPPHDNHRKRINPLRIHLGKRPFVDNSQQYCSAVKKKKPLVNKPAEPSILPRNNLPRVPKLIPKRLDRSHLHNVMPPVDHCSKDNERNKPVPRLVPKSQLAQFKKGKVEKGAQLKEYAQSLGLQPMVKFKCRKCCSMSFKTLAMLKEHQLVCRAQAKEPALSPEAAPNTDSNAGGPSRVTRKVYLCSACGTYYENWNLFLHMREVHNRHICLFCLGMFSKAEKLSAHLTNKHHVQEFRYDCKEEFFKVYNGTLYLMCCMCDEICSEKDDFFNHDCNNVKPKPVPVLVSKNAVKPNSAKLPKINDSCNGPSSISKDLAKPVNDSKCVKELIDEKQETVTSQTNKVVLNSSDCEPVNSDTSISSEHSTSSGKDTSKDTKDSGMDLDSSSTKPPSPIQQREQSPELRQDFHNGDDNTESSEESDSQTQHNEYGYNSSFMPSTVKSEEPICPLVEKEKEGGGIKLKLSLNNANSPVIINSTVDPTVGKQHSAQKPPSRTRRPPKRYEKALAEPPILPKTPSIKMTICDKADSPFVKTTIYENNQETTLKTLLNNNLENATKTPEHKPENTIKTTIYDNKLEDDNAMNRVPKLTVRVPKELLDKDSSSDYSSDSDFGDKLTVDENKTIEEPKDDPKEGLQSKSIEPDEEVPIVDDMKEEPKPLAEETIDMSENLPADVEPLCKTEPTDDINIEVKAEEADALPLIELNLDRPLDKYPLKDLLKVFLASTVHNCVYCNHIRKIAVNCEHLCLHMVEQHRFSATVDSITAEELLPETITAKVRAGAEELRSVYINLDSYDSFDRCEGVQFDQKFECFQCYFKTAVHKDLYLHNRKMHQRTILLCVMCKSNFYSYSELLCHLCPGTYDSEYEIKFRCCLCDVDSIPSSFRLMVHLRKIHHACNVCLEFCQGQSRLSNHVWKHKLHHLCYRCGIAYRNKPDITKHLFWKHGTESVMCKKCMQKKWPHVYHFCIPPTVFACDECTLQFTRAVYLKVHKRFHSNEFPHVCTEEGCTEKFVSKKLLMKHADEHIIKLFSEDLSAEKTTAADATPVEMSTDPHPVIDLVKDKPAEAGTSDKKSEPGSEVLSKKSKKKKLKDKDAMLIDVNLPALNLSESDSSDESDSGGPVNVNKDEKLEEKPAPEDISTTIIDSEMTPVEVPLDKVEEKAEPAEEKPDDQKVLEIWDNFKKYQAKVEKEKTPPLVPIRKHVCESDHDYCLVPNDLNGDDDMFSLDKKKSKKSPKKKHGDLSSSSSSSSDSDSSCSCGSNCSCSSSSGSSSSSSSDSDSSDESGNEKKKNKQLRKALPNRRLSNGSNVDVMGMSETPILVPEKTEPPINETDLETDESETDEEFYDEHPQKLANKLHAEKRNQLLLLASVAAPDGVSAARASRAATPVKEVIEPRIESEIKDKPPSSKKKSKKKKKSKNSKKHGPIKLNIPKDVIMKSEMEPPQTPLIPNKITISLQSNTVQLPEAPIPSPSFTPTGVKRSANTSSDSKRASKRRRVPNKFYGYTSDEEGNQQAATSALKPQLPPKLEWRKEDLPSPVTHKPKKEAPSTTLTQRIYSYPEPAPIRLTAPIPDPEPPRILMNSESLESSDSDSSEEGALEIFQPQLGPPSASASAASSGAASLGLGPASSASLGMAAACSGAASAAPAPAPTYLNSGTSSLPYPFQRPAARQAREGESVYCYCRCPYDEVSEMIACDAEGCPIEWFHFECVGIMVPPKGRWYCPECRKNQSFSGYR